MKRIANKNYFIGFFICLVVFCFYSHTLNYSWKIFDEDIIFNETLIPIPKSFSEVFEFIKLFGHNHYFEASNPAYSSIGNLRNILNFYPMIFIFYLFQKNSFCYHLFQLGFHILNTFILFLTLQALQTRFTSKNNLTINPTFAYLVTSLLTLIWALHPANIETVLFAANWSSPMAYFYCFLIFFICLSFKQTLKTFLLIAVLFLLSIFTSEHALIFPAIMFSYFFIESKDENQLFKDSIKRSFKTILPFIIPIIFFLVYCLSSPIKTNFLNQNKIPLNITFERIFWLAPQIFFHLIKLFIFPLKLSIDQTSLATLGETLLSPYAMFCFFFLLFISILFIYLLAKRNSKYLYLLIFLIALLPFLHIVTPIYNLASERYLYFPSYFLIVAIFQILIRNLNNPFNARSSIFILLVIICFYSCRTYIRTLDWKDDFSLLESAIQTAPNGLFRGLREENLANSFPQNSKEAIIFHNKAIASLTETIKAFEYKEKESQDKCPSILKYYGLDPKTKKIKAVFLLSITDSNITGNSENAYKILSTYIRELDRIDSKILSFYYRILFLTKRIDEAESLLKNEVDKNRISPTILVALSDLYEYKYNDLQKTEYYLLKSFKYFPYDPATLFGLQRLYKSLNKYDLYLHYLYMFGIRSHDAISLKEAAFQYLKLNNQTKAKHILKKLLNYYPVDTETQYLKVIYERLYGQL